MSTNIWLRLEPSSLGTNLEAGLRAAVHDPLWMLARQWQIGEFRFENVGSPVHAQMVMNCTPLTRNSSNKAVKMGSLPLETIIEREKVRMDGKDQPRLVAEAGLHFLRLLAVYGDSGKLRSAILKVEEFRLQPPDEKRLKELEHDHNTVNFLRVMANRVPDGHVLYDQVQKKSQDWQAWYQSHNPAERDTIDKTVKSWSEWYKTLFSEPDADESAWLPNRLEYRISVAAPAPEGEIVLNAPEYSGGHLDWYSFNIQQGGSLGAKRTDLNPDEIKAEKISCSAIPMPINYRGMPVSRYWEFEDARVDFGAMAAGRQQLAKLLLIDFALITGDDWFIVPVMVPVGTLCNTHTLEVRNTFGELLSVSSAYNIDRENAKKEGRPDKELPWSMFQLSFDSSSNTSADFNLFLPPTLGTSLHGPDLEEVLLLRDEMANMAWAVERVVEGPLGQAFNRSEEFFRSRESQSPPSGFASEENPPALVYRLESEVPQHWISLQPYRIGDDSPPIWFKPFGDAQGRILAEKEPIHEEEVPREGAYVARAWQYARWINGETYLWIGCRKGVGRGEGSSGLQFDRLIPPKTNT
ncbi:hypothetical protein [Nitrosomonas sp.]|uniref:hypothetical protein n=1 Tax=Nitrosomonas sp. TaxID=42353 RepID=UPI00260F3F4F|nr:hypothetical protein [Nitrosomonas sp.]